MRMPIVLGLFAAAVVAVGCGGGGSSTSPPVAQPTNSATSTPSTNPSSSPSTNPSSSPTASPAVFTGGTQTVAFTSSGGTFTLAPADNGYSGTVAWGANNATSGFNFTMSWATLSQITGTFSPGALPASIGTALLYLDFNSTATISFTQTPAMTVSTTGSFPGTSCGFAVFSSQSGSTKTWNSMTSLGIAEVTPSGGSFTVNATTLPAPNTVDFTASTDQYVALYCH